MSANQKWEREYTEFKIDFPKCSFGYPDNTVYPVNNASQLYKVSKLSFPNYKSYCGCVEKAGYTLKSHYTTEVYDCCTFFNDDILLYVYYCIPARTLRIITEPDALLPEQSPVLQGKCELYQLSLDQSVVDCGMSYVIKLCDDSFFIIDGGYFTQGECDRLFKFLTEHSNGEIIIAGWFFSHAHEDHFGCFMDFAEKYSTRVKIEKLYYNFPSMYIPQSVYWKSEDIISTERFYKIINQHMGNIPQIKLHSGECFNVRNLSFEVLLTHEDLYPNDIRNFNDSSTILMMTVNGKRVLWLGDAGSEESDLLINIYGSKLKADIVQVAHHGFNGAKRKVYELADAVTCLWPTADYCFDKNIYRRANSYLLKKSKTAKEHIISGYGTKAVILE